MKKRKGVALVTVVFVFFILSVFITIMFSYFMNNLRVSAQQKDDIRAYYYTAAGTEFGTAALYTTRPSGTPGVDPISLYDDFVNDRVTTTFSVLDESGNPITPNKGLLDVITFDANGIVPNPTASTKPIAKVTIMIRRMNMALPTEAPDWRIVLDVWTVVYGPGGVKETAREHGRTIFSTTDGMKISEYTR